MEDEILAIKGPATYTDGLTEGNWEQVITDSSVGEGPSLAPSPVFSYSILEQCVVYDITSHLALGGGVLNTLVEYCTIPLATHFQVYRTFT